MVASLTTEPSENVSLSDDSGTRALLIRALIGSDHPMSVSAILQTLPRSVRPSEEEALRQLRAATMEGIAFEYPICNKSVPFWHQEPSQFARQQLVRKLNGRLKTQAFILAEVGKLKALSGLSKSDIRRVFDELVRDGSIHKLPSYLGARTFLFSTSPIQSIDYLDDAVAKLSKKLGVAPEEMVRQWLDAKMGSVPRASNVTRCDGDAPTDVRIIEAMRELDPRIDHGAMVAIADLRALMSAHLDGPWFDRAMLDLSAAGRIAIHPFDRADAVSPSERAMLLCDERGRTYNTVSLR